MAALMFRTCCRKLLSAEHRGLRLQGIRYILAGHELKLDTFRQLKVMKLNEYNTNKDEFFKSLVTKLKNSEEVSFLDLQSMIYMCESESDIQQAQKCLQGYCATTEEVKYRFGPLFIRSCHSLGLVDIAYQVVMDKPYGDSLSDYTSYVLLLDMLYKHGQYERALKVLLDMRAKQFIFKASAYILSYALCYKLNTTESLEISLGLYENAMMRQTHLPVLSLCFLSLLALKQGDYATAINASDKILKKSQKLACNLDLLIAAKLEDEKKMMQILEAASEQLKSEFKRSKFSKEVMDVVEEKLKSTDSFEKFSSIYEDLRMSDQIRTETLDEMLHNVAAKLPKKLLQRPLGPPSTERTFE